MKGKGGKRSKNKEDIKEKITEMLELPKEVVMDVPKLTFIGNKHLSVENYKGIIEYTDRVVRINTNNHMLKITGQNLEINNITSEEIQISGNISTLEFII